MVRASLWLADRVRGGGGTLSSSPSSRVSCVIVVCVSCVCSLSPSARVYPSLATIASFACVGVARRQAGGRLSYEIQPFCGLPPGLPTVRVVKSERDARTREHASTRAREARSEEEEDRRTSETEEDTRSSICLICLDYHLDQLDLHVFLVVLHLQRATPNSTLRQLVFGRWKVKMTARVWLGNSFVPMKNPSVMIYSPHGMNSSVLYSPRRKESSFHSFGRCAY